MMTTKMIFIIILRVKKIKIKNYNDDVFKFIIAFNIYFNLFFNNYFSLYIYLILNIN